MGKSSRDFQIFVKPAGAACNLDCQYCYYREKTSLYPDAGSFRMSEDLLEEYTVQHIEAASGTDVDFSWHGGEPTTLGLDFFRKAVSLQQKHKPAGWSIRNGIQTNGFLLDEEWCRFFAAEGFSVGLSLDGPAELHDPYRVTRGGKPTHAQAMRAYELLRATFCPSRPRPPDNTKTRPAGEEAGWVAPHPRRRPSFTLTARSWPIARPTDQQPNATNKYTYTAQQFYRADSPLLPSGLLGPVQFIRSASE